MYISFTFTFTPCHTLPLPVRPAETVSPKGPSAEALVEHVQQRAKDLERARAQRETAMRQRQHVEHMLK
jgi:hypothetical protein